LMLILGFIYPAALLFITILYMKESRKPDHNEVFDAINNIDTNNLDNWNEHAGGPGTTATLIKGFTTETILALILQMTGINAVMFYGPLIISQAGGFFKENNNLLNIGIGFFNFVFTILAAALVERLGRKPLMITGTSILSLSLIVLGIIFIPGLKAILTANPINLGIAVFVCLIIYIFGFEIGPGCLFWVLVNENFPKEHSKYKETAATYANVLQWILNLLVSSLYPLVSDYPIPVFLFFGIVGIACNVYLLIFMEETRN